MSEKIMDSLQQAHQEKLARLDRQFLNERHDLQRGVVGLFVPPAAHFFILVRFVIQ